MAYIDDVWGEEQYRELQVWKYAHLSAFAILVWDWIICLADEVEWIWRPRKNPFSVLCLVVRYMPLPMYAVSVISVFQMDWAKRTCESIAVMPTLFALFGIVNAHVVFLIRTWALYGRSRKVLFTLCCALTLDTVLPALSLIDQRVVTPPAGYGCLPGGPRLVFGVLAWVGPLIFDTMVFAFTLWKTFRFVMEHRSDAPLFVVFLRDGVVYFAVMFICYFSTVVVYVLAPPDLKDINTSFSVALTLVMTERLLLNLRIAAHKPDDIDMFSVSASRAGMTFAERARVHMSTLVAEMEAGVQRELHMTVQSDNQCYALEFDTDVQTFRTANESIELQDMRTL